MKLNLNCGYRNPWVKKALVTSVATVFLFNAVVFISPLKSKADYVPPSTITTSDIIAADSNLMISYPHYGTPVFTEPGATFTAEVRAASSYGTTGWTAWVENEYQVWNCTVGTVTYGSTNVYLGTKGGYQVPVTLPSNVSPELCTLVLQKGTLTLRSPMSVNIVPELDASFYAAAVTDTHLGWNNEDDADGDNSPTAWGLMTKALSTTGIRFLSHTGDSSMYPIYSREKDIREGIIGKQLEHSGSRVPLVFTAGNHEYDTWTYPNPSITSGTYFDENGNGVQDSWEYDGLNTFTRDVCDRFFGMRSALMKMGTFLVAKHDIYAYWGDTAVRNAMSSKWNAVTGVNYRLLLEHTHVGDGLPMFETPMGTPTPSPYPNLEVKGHDHSWNVNQTSPYRVISAGGGTWTAGTGALLSFNYSGGSWSTPQATSWSSSNKVAFIDRITRALKIYETYNNSNNGTATSNSCTVTNQVNFNFYDGRVRFVMAPGNYNVTGGTKLSQYNSADGSKTIVLVDVNIPASSTATVSVAPAVTETILMSDSFNTYTTGQAPTGYLVNASGGIVSVEENPSATEKSLMVSKADANANFATCYKKFTAQSSNMIKFSTWAMSPTTADKKFILLRNYDETKFVFKIHFDNGYITANDTISLQPFVANNWYFIEVEMDMATKTAVVKINSTTMGTYSFKDTTATDVGEVMFSIHPNNKGTMYINYFKVARWS